VFCRKINNAEASRAEAIEYSFLLPANRGKSKRSEAIRILFHLCSHVFGVNFGKQNFSATVFGYNHACLAQFEAGANE
jgi:hypothetical protein